MLIETHQDMESINRRSEARAEKEKKAKAEEPQPKFHEKLKLGGRVSETLSRSWSLDWKLAFCY